MTIFLLIQNNHSSGDWVRGVYSTKDLALTRLAKYAQLRNAQVVSHERQQGEDAIWRQLIQVMPKFGRVTSFTIEERIVDD